jgi:hypothetical protein
MLKSGKTIGKKGEDSYIFTTIFRKDNVFQKFLNDNIIKRDNFFKF